MGGLLAFRVGNYDNTAEREQFRFLCEQLKVHYENSNDFCVFAGNYNIGCELDALFIKKDAIIAIEFKNYGGTIVATENGEWKCDGQIIKGGSRKTVLQQARINHSIVKKELKALGVNSKNIKDVPTLVIFNQPIKLENLLCATTKSWLHITDNEHFIEKLDDITCPHTDLDPLGIVNLAELLNLNSFYLAEFSNANYDKPTTSPEQLSVFEDIKIYEGHSHNSIKQTEISQDDKQEHIDLQEGDVVNEQEIQTEESAALKGFVKQILSSVLKLSDAVVTVWEGISLQSKLAKYGITIHNKYLVKVESTGIGTHCSKLSKFINHEVKAITPDVICWQDGDTIDELQKNTERSKIVYDKMDHSATDNGSVKFHKSKTIIPHWLDLALFNNLGAVYSPEYKKFEYNLDTGSEDIKVYLGTYFPRSYAESFCIFDDLFKSRRYLEVLKQLPEINILDFGCGTGGELIGLVVSLSKHLPEYKTINIIAIDGNHEAIIALKELVDILSSNVRHNISLSCVEKTIQSKNDLQISDLPACHFILNSKMACELISRRIIEGNCYYTIVESLSKLLAEDGLIYMLDVTTKDEHSNLFYPQLMTQGLNRFVSCHKDYATLLPLACNNWRDCREACFMQQTFNVSHSRKSGDESRVCYRIICKKDTKDIFIPDNTLLKGYSHIIHPQKYKQNEESSLCPKSYEGTKVIDSYNIIT